MDKIVSSWTSYVNWRLFGIDFSPFPGKIEEWDFYNPEGATVQFLTPNCGTYIIMIIIR